MPGGGDTEGLDCGVIPSGTIGLLHPRLWRPPGFKATLLGHPRGLVKRTAEPPRTCGVAGVAVVDPAGEGARTQLLSTVVDRLSTVFRPPMGCLPKASDEQ